MREMQFLYDDSAGLDFFTAYEIVKISSNDLICQCFESLSTNAAINKNCINPKKNVNDVRESLAGYFFTMGACILVYDDDGSVDDG